MTSRLINSILFLLLSVVTTAVGTHASTDEILPAGFALPADRVDHVTSHSRILRSAILQEVRVFKVHLPVGYETSGLHYPVLYVLDGAAYSGLVAETAQLLTILGRMPQLIVVAVANVDRTRDMTPFSAADAPTSGGGEKFLRFLTEELQPRIEQDYRTLPFNILFGHSLGGSFVTHTLLTHPTAFSAGLAASPALYHDRGRLLHDIERALDKPQVVPPRFLYMAIGDEIGYEASLDHLTELLDQNPQTGLRWEAHKYPDETHDTIILHTLHLCLKALYKNWALSQTALNAGQSEVEAHYRNVSAELGYEVQIPENIINILGYRALAENDFMAATKLFRRNVANYPWSFNVHDSLAEAYYRRGMLGLAVANYNKSLELNPDNENAVRMLEKIRAEQAGP